MCIDGAIHAHVTEQARRLGANAIIGVRFENSSIAAGAAEILFRRFFACVRHRLEET